MPLAIGLVSCLALAIAASLSRAAPPVRAYSFGASSPAFGEKLKKEPPERFQTLGRQLARWEEGARYLEIRSVSSPSPFQAEQVDGQCLDNEPIDGLLRKMSLYSHVFPVRQLSRLFLPIIAYIIWPARARSQMIVAPPSMTITWPVIWPPASEASSKAAPMRS
jgi:hypothetical protein